MMELRIKIPLPEDPVKRALVITIIGSILLHVLLLAWLITMNPLGTSVIAKRGEPLLVDLAPDRPEEKAPLGNPSRPAGAPEPAPKAPEPPTPAPKMPEAPPAPKISAPPKAPPTPRAPPAARPVPEPPKQVAKAEPPPPAPKAPPPPKAPAEPPAPSPDALTKPPDSPAAKPSDTPPPQAERPRTLVAPPAVPPGSGGERPGSQTQTALARPPATPPPSIFRQPGGGGGGLRGGRGGVEGEPIPLDTQEPKYQDYFNKIREKIKANWIYPREAGDRGIQGELMLEFHIAKDGRLAYLELRSTSGAEILDRFAMNAVRLAQPFPPVPDDVAKQVLSINGIFKYQIVGTSLLNQYLR